MLLRVPPGQVAHVAAAERLGTVLLGVRLRDRAELLDPLLLVVEPVGVVDHVAHLVAEVAQDVGPVEPLDVADPLGVQCREVGPGQVEGNGDGDSLERHAPLGREVEPGPHPGHAGPAQIVPELLDDRLEGGTRDGEAEVPDRRGPEVGLVKPGGRWCGDGFDTRHGDKHTC